MRIDIVVRENRERLLDGNELKVELPGHENVRERETYTESVIEGWNQVELVGGVGVWKMPAQMLIDLQEALDAWDSQMPVKTLQTLAGVKREYWTNNGWQSATAYNYGVVVSRGGEQVIYIRPNRVEVWDGTDFTELLAAVSYTNPNRALGN